MNETTESANRTKVYAYLRKSTEENKEGESRRQQNSLEYQKRSVEETARKNNLEIVRTFKDSKTGYKAFVRDGFNKMMDQIDQDGLEGEVKGIVCSEHSRLARNFADGGLLLWYLQCGLITEIYTHDKKYTKTPDDQMILAISFAMDKYASDVIGFRMGKAWDIKVSEGQPPNQHRRGYNYVGDEGKKVWKVDPIYGPLIKELFAEFATGMYTLDGINDYMVQKGLVNPITKKKFSKNTILDYLRSIEYTGIFYHKGVKHNGEYTPLISSELFYKVQEVLEHRSHPKSAVGNDYAYSGGLIKCDVCGGNMSGTIKKGITYYRCLNRNEPCRSQKNLRPSYLREKDIDDEIKKVFKRVQISEKDFEKFSNYVSQLFEDEKSKYISDLRIFKMQRNDVEEELKGYTKELMNLKKINKGERDDLWKSQEEGYLILMTDCSEKIKSIDRTIESAEEMRNQLPKVMVNFLDALRTVGDRFSEASPLNKRMIVRTLCANFKWDGKKLVWKWRKPYHVLTNSDEMINWLRE
ncbi:MAG: recombinase family protein [Candidatus Dojkabacteria bacterium]